MLNLNNILCINILFLGHKNNILFLGHKNNIL